MDKYVSCGVPQPEPGGIRLELHEPKTYSRHADMNCLQHSSLTCMHVYLTRALLTIHGDMQRIHTHRSSFALPVQISLGILIGRKATKLSQLSSLMIYTPIKVSPTYYYMGKKQRSGPDHLVEVYAVVYQKGHKACLNFSAYLMCWTQYGDLVPAVCQLTAWFDRPWS